MTAVADPLLGVTPREHAGALLRLATAVIRQAEAFALRPTDVNLHRELGHTAVAIEFGSRPDDVDVLAAAFGLPPAAPGGLHLRAGSVLIYGEPVAVTLYAAHPAAPSAVAS